MVASGLPVRNKERHLLEIACLALDLMDAAEDFQQPGKEQSDLDLRVGIHTGMTVVVY